jgi:hypothetical protein
MTHKLNNNFFAIEVPEDAELIAVYAEEGVSELTYWHNDGKDWCEKPLPAGNWTFICTSKGITEEQAAEVVQSAPNAPMHIYKDYQQWNEYYRTALESFRSLLRSLSLTGDIAIINNQE